MNQIAKYVVLIIDHLIIVICAYLMATSMIDVVMDDESQLLYCIRVYEILNTIAGIAMISFPIINNILITNVYVKSKACNDCIRLAYMTPMITDGFLLLIFNVSIWANSNNGCYLFQLPIFLLSLFNIMLLMYKLLMVYNNSEFWRNDDKIDRSDNFYNNG